LPMIRLILLILPNGLRLIFNPKTGKSRSFQKGDSINFDSKLEKWIKLESFPQTIDTVCLPTSIEVIDDDCNCLIQNADVASPLGSNLEEVQDLALTAMCQSETFNPTDWSKLTPPITKGQISKKQAQLYLKRFQKFGGYSDTHLPILTAILKSDLVETHPDLVNQTLKALALSRSETVQAFYHLLKIDQRMPSKYSLDESNKCKSGFEKNLETSKIEYLKSVSGNIERKTTTEDWLEFKPFKEELQKLPKEQRDAIVDGIAESLSRNAMASPELNGVFQSKLYYFSKKWALNLVGDTAKSATDLGMAISNGKATPIVLGSGDLPNASSSKYEDSINSTDLYGFQFKVMDPISIPKDSKVGEKKSKKISGSMTARNTPQAPRAPS
ncbi:MAG TPA: hypothetical protein VIG33_05900, partial [Pseudobdellovibrionaceae bacterium]